MNKFFDKFKIVFSNCKKKFPKGYYLLRSLHYIVVLNILVIISWIYIFEGNIYERLHIWL